MDIFVGNKDAAIGLAAMRYPAIPLYTLEALCRYVYDKIPTGDFLFYVLSNNLVRSIQKADENNRAALLEIVNFIYNEIPSPAWGSKEKVEAWLSGE